MYLVLMYLFVGSHIKKIKDLPHGHVNSPWDLIQVVKLPSCSLRMKRWFLCLYVAPCSNQFTPVKDVLSPFLWHLEVNSSWQIVVQDCHINSFGLFFLSSSFFFLLQRVFHFSMWTYDMAATYYLHYTYNNKSYN